jgi:hypothetical protein
MRSKKACRTVCSYLPVTAEELQKVLGYSFRCVKITIKANICP